MAMRFLLIFFLSFTTSLVLGQKQMLFIDTKYEEALAVAKTEKKPLAMLFYTNWCPHCKKMKSEIFTDNEVVKFYQDNFVCMAVDADSAEGKDLRAKFISQFKVTSFPTFAFIDTSENLLYCNSGEFKKEAFIAEGTGVLMPENQLPNIKKAFESEPSNPDKCLKYIIALRLSNLDATPVAQKYFSTKTEEERFSEINWKVFSNGINNFDTPEFKFVIKNKEAFGKVVSPTRVDKKIAYTISEVLKSYADVSDTINYNKKRSVAQSFELRKIDSLIYAFDLQILSQTSNWKKYQKVTLDNVGKFSWNDTTTLFKICDTYLKEINEKKGLSQAVIWSKHLLSLNESKDKYILATKLLLKLKNYKQAAEMAQKGKSFVENVGFNADELNALLEQIKKQS